MQRSLLLLFFLSALHTYAQVNTRIYMDGKPEEQLAFKDSLALTEYISQLNLKLIRKGYLFSGLDSIRTKENVRHIFFHRGEKSSVGIDGSRRNLMKSIEKRAKKLRDSGYPFSSVSIDSADFANKTLTGKLIENRGPLILNDSAFFYREVKTSADYIYRLLEHIPEEPFNESVYKKTAEKLDRSPFLNLTRPVDVAFRDGKAKLYLDLEESESGSFQGVLGLQQQAAGSSNAVGSFDLSIQNLFRSGKELDLHWESFRQNSQELRLYYKHPFIFRSKIHPFFRFDLLKQDSTFLRRAIETGFSTYVSNKLETTLSYTRTQGSLLTTETVSLQNSNLADFGSDLYRIELRQGRFEKLNQLRSGIAWRIGTSLGSKSIERNLSLNDAFYDTLQLETDIFLLDLKLAAGKRVFDRQVISVQVEVGVLENDELLDNEKYRLGGLNSLRGFDEKIIFADRYFLSRTEFRSFFEKGSFIYLFYDQLIYRNSTFSDEPFGTGLGFSLATQSGQFSFALGVGKSDLQQIDLSNIKIHFGYLTTF